MMYGGGGVVDDDDDVKGGRIGNSV